MAGGKLGEFCQVLFPLIVANTDDFGRFSGDAFTVKNVVLPSSRRPERDFDQALDVMADVGLVERYQVNGGIYLQIHQFETHQPNLHKRSSSRYPESPGSSGNYRSNIREPRTQNPELIPEGNPEPAQCADGFEAFWATYPKKKAKDDARKAWDKRRPDAALQKEILAAIERQKRSRAWRQDKGKYIPHPASWLNGARWTDEVEDDVPPLVSEKTQQNIANREEALRLIEQNAYGTRG